MNSLVLLLTLSVAVNAVPVAVEDLDEDCHMVWITVNGDVPSTSHTSIPKLHGVAAKDKQVLKVTATTAAQATPPSSDTGTASSPPSPSAVIGPGISGVVSSNHADEPGFPLDGEHLSAPQSSVAVPDGALIYTPPSKSFSGKAFGDWWTAKKNANPATKWVKVTPGVYDLSVSDGIAIGFTPGGWTLDLRGVVFLVDPDIPDHTSGQAIYINQSEDMTLLGGTVWFDQGEQWSQAKVISITPIDDMYSKATFTVEEGYNASVWNNAGPRNQGCVDTSDPNHYTRPDCNFWYADQYDFSGLSSSGNSFTSRITSRANIKVGFHVTMIAGPDERTTIASEFNGGLHVNGMTSNGGLAQYGLNNKVTATFENVWFVNPPARPGFAPRVEGPTLSMGHIGLFDFNADGQPNIVYQDSWWQTTGCAKDVQNMANQTLP